MPNKRPVFAIAAVALVATVFSALAPAHVHARSYKAVAATSLPVQTIANHSLINTILNNQVTLRIAGGHPTSTTATNALW